MITAPGVILMLLIAFLVTYAITWARRRMGRRVSARTWTVLMVTAVIAQMALWAAQTR